MFVWHATQRSKKKQSEPYGLVVTLAQSKKKDLWACEYIRPKKRSKCRVGLGGVIGPSKKEIESACGAQKYGVSVFVKRVK